jgi:hypothetical protein
MIQHCSWKVSFLFFLILVLCAERTMIISLTPEVRHEGSGLKLEPGHMITVSRGNKSDNTQRRRNSLNERKNYPWAGKPLKRIVSHNTHVYCSTRHSSQAMETNKVPILM